MSKLNEVRAKEVRAKEVRAKEVRARGAKPQDPEARRLRVKTAVRELEKIGAAFSVADVAARAGVSRATIYRSQDLRDLIGAKGNGPRTVDAALHEKICARHDTQKAKVRDLRRARGDREGSGGARGGRGKNAPLGPEERRRSRRILARALHPDLFAQDAAAYALATELLKTLNALAE